MFLWWAGLIKQGINHVVCLSDSKFAFVDYGYGYYSLRGNGLHSLFHALSCIVQSRFWKRKFFHPLPTVLNLLPRFPFPFFKVNRLQKVFEWHEPSFLIQGQVTFHGRVYVWEALGVCAREMPSCPRYLARARSDHVIGTNTDAGVCYQVGGDCREFGRGPFAVTLLTRGERTWCVFLSFGGEKERI